MNHCKEFMAQVSEIARNIDCEKIHEMVQIIHQMHSVGGTLYIVGLGGSASNASHMAADLRNLCEINAWSLDNVAEITARANDEGWETIFDGFLSEITMDDCLFVLSVGGGTSEVSAPINRAVEFANVAGAKVLGVVGPIGGYTAEYGDCVVKIPAMLNKTPHTEAFQAVVWHLFTSHPLLQRKSAKWI